MSFEGDQDYYIERVLEAIDDEMASPKQPKVLLFDIGGVCVVSPFQAILDYELSLGIPPGWINYSISKSAPDGYWHRLERGAIPLDRAFFDGFNRDLHDARRWRAFCSAREQSGHRPPRLPPGDLPALPALDGEWLFNEMMAKSHAPDPWMLPALERLRDSGAYLLGALSNTIIFPPGHALHSPDFFNDPLRRLFDVFISSAHVGLRKPDPDMYRLAVATLDRYARDKADSPRGRRLGWADGIRAADILFLDDIGENLREAKAQGFGTIKVHLGRAYEAVQELEEVTGLKLEGNHPKIPIKPSLSSPKARI